MTRILISPNKYVQGKGVIKELGEYLDDFGEKVLALCDPVVLELFTDKVKEGLANKDVKLEEFNGEASKKEIDRLKEMVQKEKIEVVVGIGGGKTLDTAKAVSYYAGLPVGIVPTIAATDAPCSALSVIYTEDGVFEEYLFLPSNPDLVLVDTKIVAKAPVRFLVSGMGDALATYFEADACSVTKAPNIPGGTQTITATNLAKLCYDTLIEYGTAAKEAVEAEAVTEAVEKIVEANTLLSGLGFESGGLAAAHAIHNGFTVLEETHSKTHGEKVAYSTIVQLVMEDRPPELIEEVIRFCKEVGLPTTLVDLGIEEINEEDILKVAETSSVEDETIHNMPFEVDAEMVKDAILAVDRLGK
ncbi:glycerol dehydrogenase [Acetohalobium arabaticum]|uniref:Glycerol dehydrogenase n=1 Tax=Acetohalobium arabaticum (strain ATCC 49924 / DSM 5501 / Z-7288) TaxID=574087 RepID=D9QVT8_ACEAZ|nr:glycerol dehydrogenase [Acetohalobium arabaticum]ADL12347.1 glycerol 2-dehydrogenase (NAD+) [Acetohalobium arabaticum DSM 5501]